MHAHLGSEQIRFLAKGFRADPQHANEASLTPSHRHFVQFEENGYAILPSVLEEDECGEIAAQVTAASGRRAGTRTLLTETWRQKLAQSLEQHPVVTRLLPPNPITVQCILFDKSPEKDWLVSFHQDLSIPVKEKIDNPECSCWSEKEGIFYVQPPVEVLEQIVAVRVHLDECGPLNGPLRVVPGSHRQGRLAERNIEAERKRLGEVVCCVAKGGALVMRPLLLHASSKVTAPNFRRVLHFVFGPPSLPCGLRWCDPV